ncbi:MAG: Gfo/Idh/MocA family oxidoreductase [Burkholderiales bacterium]|nr:Gfo/Idh/MocA family oxidoreductase [Burkholderiales bacterium]
MKPLRIALAGLGVIGRAHLEWIGASAECVACAVADPFAAAAPSGLPLYRSLGELIDRERPDGVILATPNAVHVDGAIECIAAGIPCLVEKPVADTLADASRLAAAVAASSVAVLVGHHRRHSPILQAAAAAIAAGAVGRVVAVMASAVFAKPASYFQEAPWRRQPGGGPILINLVHEIDNLRQLVGEISQVQALASNAVRGFAVEDTVAINLRFANGALGTFMLSDCAASVRSWEQTSGENKAYDHHGDEDCYLVAGTRGSLAVPTLRLHQAEGEASWFEPLAASRLEAARADPLQRQLAHFCAMIRGEAPPLVPVAEALKTLDITLAVAAAAANRQAQPCFTE